MSRNLKDLMRTRCLPAIVPITLLAMAVPASAGRTWAPSEWQCSSTTLLYLTPTADVLPVGSLAFSVTPTIPLTQTSMNVSYPEADASVRFSPYRHLDFAVTAYTFQDYVLDARYQVLGGGLDRLSLAVGVYDIGLSSYVSPIGHDAANSWPDWKYKVPERFSAYAVTSFPVTQFFRVHIGLGRGRFVGYDSHNKYLNTDIFFKDHHQWALGLLGGAEVFLTPMVAVVAEVGGRDMNSGVRFNFDRFTATVAWTKMEGLIFAKGGPDGCPKFGRLEFGLNYQFNNLTRQAKVTRPREHIVPPVKPVSPRLALESVPAAPAPSKSEFRLLPVYFELDNTAIRPEYADVLKRNAEAILAKAKAGLKADVIIEGHCCPLASEAYNVGLGMRRAEAAKAYLVGLGVDAGLLTTQTYGKANPPYRERTEYYLDRRCEFKWKY
jgi:outer membrane protein OmpA-like peptidoglycan-associated protein